MILIFILLITDFHCDIYYLVEVTCRMCLLNVDFAFYPVELIILTLEYIKDMNKM